VSSAEAEEEEKVRQQPARVQEAAAFGECSQNTVHVGGCHGLPAEDACNTYFYKDIAGYSRPCTVGVFHACGRQKLPKRRCPERSAGRIAEGR